MAGLTIRQRAALAGNHRYRAWLAGRRAGKSYAAACWLLGGKPGQISAYCARTLKSAKAIMLTCFADLNAKYNLGLEIRRSTGTIIEKNGAVIQLYGLRDQTQADLLRGQKFRRVFVDEGGAFTDELLKYSIESVIQPLLVDWNGELIIGGTPGVIPRGYFYDVTGNPGLSPPIKGRWPAWHWDARENPFVTWGDVVRESIEVNGWNEASATFKREYLALWCEDLEALIYRYRGEGWNDTPWATPPQQGVTVMGIDFGVVDSTTWCIGRQGYETRPHVFICEALARDHIELPEIARITRELMQKWSVNRILADEGALGKAIANTLRTQYHLPIEAAQKAHKRARIDGVRGRIAAGTLHLCSGAKPLLEEWMSLAWNDTRDDHHPRMADDISDATLYCLGAEEFSAYEFPARVVPQVSEEDVMFQRAMAKSMQRLSL